MQQCSLTFLVRTTIELLVQVDNTSCNIFYGTVLFIIPIMVGLVPIEARVTKFSTVSELFGQ